MVSSTTVRVLASGMERAKARGAFQHRDLACGLRIACC
jgi:hypothetical protein